MSTADDGTPLARRRGWVVAAALVVGVVGIALVAGKRQGSGAGAVTVRFGANVTPPLSSRRLDFTNAWVASSGGASVAVYAGSRPRSPHDGLLIVVRTTGHTRRFRSLVLRGSGAITLLRPGSVRTVQQASQALLHFVAASGSTGTLDLSSDRTSVTR